MTRRIIAAGVFAVVLASAFVTAAGSARGSTAARPASVTSHSASGEPSRSSIVWPDRVPIASPRASADWRQREPPPIAVTCTFANPSYAGDCVEKTTRTEKEKPAAACRPILDCLNNPRCVKNYCQATTIRQGWTLKKVE